MPPRTNLKNQYEKYFEAKPTEWHRNIIGEYHVSAVGVNHQDLEQNEHSGPCLRDTFYGYVNPIKQKISTTGNFKVGNIFHKYVQDRAKANRPCIVEFPLARSFSVGDQTIKVFGSVDIIEFDQIPKENQIQTVTFVDLKTASDYTFPYSSVELNPTHRDQVMIYAYWLQNYIFDKKLIRISKIRVVYMNKHEGYCGEVDILYDNDKALHVWVDFIHRCFELHKKFNQFLDLITGNKEGYSTIDQRILQNKCLPEKEPHHWCKFCDYRFRCRDDVIHDVDVRKYSTEEIEAFYTKETGKKPFYRNKHTKAFESYAYGFCIEDNEL